MLLPKVSLNLNCLILITALRFPLCQHAKHFAQCESTLQQLLVLQMKPLVFFIFGDLASCFSLFNSPSLVCVITSPDPKSHTPSPAVYLRPLSAHHLSLSTLFPVNACLKLGFPLREKCLFSSSWWRISLKKKQLQCWWYFTLTVSASNIFPANN